MASFDQRWVMSPLAEEVLDPGGERTFVLADWSDDGSHPGQPIAPLHVHHEEDEAWYVLEGRLRFRLGDGEIEAPSGTAVFGPRGVPHTYSNPDPRPARYLLIMQAETWSLIRALHGAQSKGLDINEVFRTHGAQLLDEDA